MRVGVMVGVVLLLLVVGSKLGGVVGRALEGPWLMTVSRPVILNMADMVRTGLMVGSVGIMES